jgi:hypothetical protein
MAATAAGRRDQLRRDLQARAVLAERRDRDQGRPQDQRRPADEVKVSRTDPEAPLGRDTEKVFGPMDTAEFGADTASRLILSFDVFPQVTDAGTPPVRLDRTAVVTGFMPGQISGDAPDFSSLDLQAGPERAVKLVAPVGANDFTEVERAESDRARIGKEPFQWLPAEPTDRGPQGHRLGHAGRGRRQRRDDHEVVQHRYRGPAEHGRGRPPRDRCVRDPDQGRTVKRRGGRNRSKPTRKG